jgi:hypothetical protein
MAKIKAKVQKGTKSKGKDVTKFPKKGNGKKGK